MKSIYQCSLILLLAFLNSCSKSNDSDRSGSSNSACNLSTAFVIGKWQIEKVEFKQSGAYENITSQIEPCQKDDYFLFNSNGTFSRVDVGITCNFTNVENGTWSYSNGKFYSNGQEQTVTAIDCNKLIREFTDKNSQQQFRYTFNRLP
jgi:hypothetical protein